MADFTAASSRTSTASGSARPPAFSIVFRRGVDGAFELGVRRLGLGGDRDVGAVARALSAIARPMPREAPVMNSVLPLSDIASPRNPKVAVPTSSLNIALLRGFHATHRHPSSDRRLRRRPRQREFYTQMLGMRLVKKTVNQDDVTAYHLFYADGEARPGTDLTFFDWPAPREKRGTHSIIRTGLRVAGGEPAVVEGAAHPGGGAPPRHRHDRRPRHAGVRGPGRPAARADRRRRAGARRVPGRRARCRPSTRSAGSARSRSACRSCARPT